MVWCAIAILAAQVGGRLYTLCATQQDTSGRIADLILIVFCGLGIWGAWPK